MRASSRSGRAPPPKALSPIPPTPSSSSGSTATRSRPTRGVLPTKPRRWACSATGAPSGSSRPSRNIAAAVDAVLGIPLQDTSVVLEAGDLAKSSPLRSLCERSPKALALPCYPDNDRDLAAVVDEALRMAGLTIDRDARAALLASLGGDRLATRAELAKLTLYAHGRRAVTLADIDAVVSDVSALALDSVVDGAFGGNLAALDDGLQRCAADGTAAVGPARGRAPARAGAVVGGSGRRGGAQHHGCGRRMARPALPPQERRRAPARSMAAAGPAPRHCRPASRRARQPPRAGPRRRARRPHAP